MTKHWQYLRYVLRHKWYVFQAARRLGIPWLGLVHDWSKFLPGEWSPYANRFYGGYERGQEPQRIKDNYDRAWHAHQRRNKHHPTYWLLHANAVGASGLPEFVCLPMPDRYRREMLADWEGARRAGADGAKGSTREWYEVNGARLPLHAETRAWVEQQLGVSQEVPAA